MAPAAMREDREVRHEAVAEADDDARRQRQVGAEAGEQRRERRDDLPQNHADHAAGDHDDRDRIDHRRLDLTGELDRLLDVGREALENRVENTAGFTGGDHVGEQRDRRSSDACASRRRATRPTRRRSASAG